MIENEKNPAEWAQLLYELDDAKEHIENLAREMSEKGKIEEIEFKIQIGHIYSHLNRVWNSRNREGESTNETFENESNFPIDLNPF